MRNVTKMVTLAVLVAAAAGCEAEQVQSAVSSIFDELAELTLRQAGELASRVADSGP